jgi:hypothetical protein
MTDTPAPLTPDQVDELLSAELDGELDAAADDLGLSSEQAQALLAAAPGVAVRREALQAARGALTAAPELDELADARMRSAALDAFRTERGNLAKPRHTYRWLAYAAGGVAAALIGVFVITASSHSSSPKESAAARAPSVEAPSATRQKASGAPPAPRIDAAAASPALGSFSTTKQLANAAFGAYSHGLVAAGDFTYTAAPEARAASGAGASKDALTPPVDACLNAARTHAGADKLVSVSNAMLGGKPVVVHVFAHGKQLLVVVQHPDCSYVSAELVP